MRPYLKDTATIEICQKLLQPQIQTFFALNLTTRQYTTLHQASRHLALFHGAEEALQNTIALRSAEAKYQAAADSVSSLRSAQWIRQLYVQRLELPARDSIGLS
jgi:hypothetical protein